MAEIPILRLGAVKDVRRFQEHPHSIGVTIPCDGELLAGPESPLWWPLHRMELRSATASQSNRWKDGRAFPTATRAKTGC
jgi:hypothetical protein